MATPIEEMLQFLDPGARDDVKFFALNHLVGMTDSDDGQTVFVENTKFIKAFLLLTEDKPDTICQNAYKALINLSASDKFTSLICDADQDFMEILILRILDKENKHADQACMLLANLTRSRESAKYMANILTKHESTKTNSRFILKEFLTILSTSAMYNKYAKFHHLAYIVSNLSQVSEISDKLVNGECLLKELLPFLDYKDSVTRRRGVAATVRNCCLNTDYHPALLSPNIDLLPSLLLPLAGPEEFDDDDNERLPVDLQYLEPNKKREPDAEIRRLLVESINQLCATKFGRTYVKDKNAYVILRELHKQEEDRFVSLAVQNVVDILIGDEPAEEYANLRTVDVPDDLKSQFEKDDEMYLKE